MEEPLHVFTPEENKSNAFDDLKRLVGYDSDESSPVKTRNNLKPAGNVSSSEEEEHGPMLRIKKKIQRFSDSDSDKEVDHVPTNTGHATNDDSNSELEDNIKTKSCKSRIQVNDSDSDASEEHKETKNGEQQMRMKNKRNKMKEKFKSLLSSRGKHSAGEKSHDKSSIDNEMASSEDSDNEISSIKSIKQKIKESMSMIPSICDPDTSDEENGVMKKHVNKSQPKKERKSTKLTSPKSVRMSAKQAMENMQKIKSESNRMLREKEVSLPYHRPKALTLKDIMSRRKPAVASDGKAFPIKMNEEQLKQYVKLLEQRQKEMMELCKSDTEDEEEPTEPDHEVEESPLELQNIPNSNTNVNTEITNIVPETLETKAIDDGNTQTSIANEDKVLEDSSTVSETNLSDADKSLKSNEIKDDHRAEEQNSFDTDMKLVYHDSVEETNTIEGNTDCSTLEQHEEISEKLLDPTENNSEKITSDVLTEPESQVISLHFNSQSSEDLAKKKNTPIVEHNIEEASTSKSPQNDNFENKDKQEEFLSDDDDDMNMDDIDKIIENAELIENDYVNSPMLVKEAVALNIKPKLTGAPGMVIDLDGSDPIVSNKLSGVELLKERFTYFAKLKTPEELEREREKRIKPGAQHLKLKQELEEQIAEQRSLEWAKRLEEEKQQHAEMNALRGDTSDAEDDIEKIEAKLDTSNEKESSSENEEEDLVEDDVELKDKPRKHNPMVDDEAEESECDDNEAVDENADAVDENIEGADEGIEPEDDEGENEDESDDESSDESLESEAETSKAKKGRILKAFEDSDDEDTGNNENNEILATEGTKGDIIDTVSTQTASQDDELELAQRLKSASDDMFSSQDVVSSTANESNKDETANDEEIATQTFSILDSKPSNAEFKSPDVVSVLSVSQPYHDPSLDALAEGLSQNVFSSQLPSQASQSQPIGEDILALCTGKFYDNQFVSQTEEDQYVDSISQEACTNDFENDKVDDNNKEIVNDNLDSTDNTKDLEPNANIVESKTPAENTKQPSDDGNLLKSILDELDDPEFGAPKPNKFFTGASQNKAIDNSQLKKKFIIDSDDETDAAEPKKKKLKKKRPEKRALHISDDEEEEEQLEQDEVEYTSDIEDDADKLVEYDSEENEIVVKPQNPKKKRKATDFFEQEAELTSEDEWVGSGDEDEAGLDRMEREAGDDDVFHQATLRKELGQIHMRDVLDQDKREVRLLQELLFEDGDLGGGHRQRKFRWRNAEGDEETGTLVDEFGDTQEEEFESEEQWRKQRHEREVFLRQMQNKEEEDLNVSVNRTTIIKANLSSKTMSSLLLEVDQSKTEKTESPDVSEKKTTKDIPSPKKSFAILKQNYHGSLLTRGGGALARLAALATPLATDDDAPKLGSLGPSSKRNFVFAALTPNEKPKVTTKRKADTNIGTPKLVKKMKTEENQKKYKSSLLDHLKAL